MAKKVQIQFAFGTRPVFVNIKLQKIPSNTIYTVTLCVQIR